MMTDEETLQSWINSCKVLEAERNALTTKCIELQQEINCLRMEPCQLPHCVQEREKLKALLDMEKNESYAWKGKYEQVKAELDQMSCPHCGHDADGKNWKALALKAEVALISFLKWYESGSTADSDLGHMLADVHDCLALFPPERIE